MKPLYRKVPHDERCPYCGVKRNSIAWRGYLIGAGITTVLWFGLNLILEHFA